MSEPTSSIDESAIIAWAAVTFPDANPRSLLKHMLEEFRELANAITDYDPTMYEVTEMPVLEEIGDLGLMLVHLAHMFGGTLAECVARKFATASQRAYVYDPALGYARHIEKETT